MKTRNVRTLDTLFRYGTSKVFEPSASLVYTCCKASASSWAAFWFTPATFLSRARASFGIVKIRDLRTRKVASNVNAELLDRGIDDLSGFEKRFMAIYTICQPLLVPRRDGRGGRDGLASTDEYK